jgi:hypothetical protein
MMAAAHWSFQDLSGRSADLAPGVTAQLQAFCNDAPRHALFLNTLSLMEHIGSRKIMASQSPTDPGHDTLKHLAEEARHAFFFKRAAEKLNGGALDYADAHTLAGPSARAYMGRLDAYIAAALGENAPAQLAYLYMSLIVELRAIWFYRLYQGALKSSGSLMSLKSVLAEEELHLEEMLEHIAALDPQMDQRLTDFMPFEAGRFRTLWSAIAQAANGEASYTDEMLTSETAS